MSEWISVKDRLPDEPGTYLYVADFAYEQLAHCNVLHNGGGTYAPSTNEIQWLPVVEDVKSGATKTAQYEMKKKLLRERFNIRIVEV